MSNGTCASDEFIEFIKACDINPFWIRDSLRYPLHAIRKINITDMIAVKATTLKKSELKGVYEKAGDVNGDGKINITDFIKVKAAILYKDTITGVTAK